MTLSVRSRMGACDVYVMPPGIEEDPDGDTEYSTPPTRRTGGFNLKLNSK